VAARLLAVAGRHASERGDAVLRTCQHRAAALTRAAGAGQRAVRVGRARPGGLVRLLEQWLEEQGSTGEAERAMRGANGKRRMG